MNPCWKLTKRPKAKRCMTKTLSITKRKVIGLTLDVREEIKTNFVQIYSCDVDNHVLIGVKPVDKEASDRHWMGQTNKNSKIAYTISFFPGLKTGRYPIEWSESDGMFVAKVGKEKIVAEWSDAE